MRRCVVSSRSRLEVLEPLLLRGSLPGAARLVTGLDECPVSGVTFALSRADVLGAGVGLPAELGVAGSLHLACSPGRAALDAREPVASDDAASDPRFAAAARALGVRSIVAAPVRVRSVAVGAVFGAAPEGRRLPAGAMSTVASAALALEQALSELHARHAPAEDLRATRADGRAHLHVLRAAGLDLVDSSGSVAVVASRLHGALLTTSKTMGAALEDATLAFAEASGAYHHVRRRLDGLLFEPDEGDVELRDHLRVVLASLVELRPLLLLAEATRSGILPAARAQRAAEALSPAESSNDLERGAAAIASWVERRCSSAPPPGLSGFPGSSRPHSR